MVHHKLYCQPLPMNDEILYIFFSVANSYLSACKSELTGSTLQECCQLITDTEHSDSDTVNYPISPCLRESKVMQSAISDISRGGGGLLASLCLLTT